MTFRCGRECRQPFFTVYAVFFFFLKYSLLWLISLPLRPVLIFDAGCRHESTKWFILNRDMLENTQSPVARISTLIGVLPSLTAGEEGMVCTGMEAVPGFGRDCSAAS